MVTASSMRASGGCGPASRSRASSVVFAARTCWRRSWSIARLRAVVINQPVGLAGSPSRGQRSAAMANASAAASSASSMSPRMPTSVASTRPHWSRKTASSTTEASVEDGPHLDRDTGPGLLEQFLGDGERPVGQQHPSVVVAQSRRRLVSVQAGPAGDVRPVEQGGKATRNRACCPVRVLGRGVGQQRVLHESSSHGSMPVSSIRRTASPWTDSNHRGDFPRRWCPSGAWPFVTAADPPERRRHDRGESMTTELTPSPNAARFERAYDAPAELIWELCTTAAGLVEWFAPDGFESRVSELELRPGGQLRYTMTATAPEQVAFMRNTGNPLSTEVRKTFTEVAPPTRLAYLSLIDFVPDHEPYEHLTTIDIEPAGDRTNVVMTVDPLHDETWTQQHRAHRGNELDNLEAAIRRRTM